MAPLRASAAAWSADQRRGDRWLEAGLLLAAVVVLSLPVWRAGREGFIGGTNDAVLIATQLEWQWWALTHAPARFFALNIFWPEAHTLVRGPLATPYLPLYLIASRLADHPAAGINASLVAVTAATLWTTRGLLRSVGVGGWASTVGAVAYAATSQRVNQVVHLESYGTFWVPALLWAILRWEQRGRPADGALLGLLLAGALLGGPYYAVGMGVVLAVGLLLRVRRLTWRHLRALAAGAASFALVAGPVVVLMLLEGVRPDPADRPPTSPLMVLDPGAMIRPLEPLHRLVVAAGGPTPLVEPWVFPGVVLVALGAVGAAVLVRRRGDGPALAPPAGWWLAVTAVVGLVLAFGSHLEVRGRVWTLPTAPLWALPGLANLRATPRLVALPWLGLAVLAAVGFRRVAGRRPALLAVVAVAVALATGVTAPPVERFADRGPPTEINRLLATQPAGVVLELPMPGCPGVGCLYTGPPRMWWALVDRRPRVGGYSGVNPTWWPTVEAVADRVPAEDALWQLRAWGIDYLVLRVHAGPGGEAYTEEEAAALAAALATSPQVRSVVSTAAGDRLVVLVPGGQDPGGYAHG